MLIRRLEAVLINPRKTLFDVDVTGTVDCYREAFIFEIDPHPSCGACDQIVKCIRIDNLMKRVKIKRVNIFRLRYFHDDSCQKIVPILHSVIRFVSIRSHTEFDTG